MSGLHKKLGAFTILLCFALAVYPQEVESTDQGIISFLEESRQYHHQDQLDKALKSLDIATELAEKLEDEERLIECYQKFALLYLDMGKIDDAYFYLENKAKVMLDQTAYLSLEAEQKYVEARLMFAEERPYEAIYLIDQARELSNDRNFLHNIVLLEGEIYSSLAKVETASTLFNSLVVNEDDFEKEYLQARAYLGLAKLYQQNGEYEESVKNGESALSIANTNDFSKLIYQSNELLEEDYEKLGEYSRSLVYSRNLLQLKDSVFTLAKSVEEAKIGNRLQLEYMSEEIQRQAGQIEQLNESANRSELTAILTSAFLTIISLLAVSLYRNNQIKLKTNDLLHTKNRELQNARDAAVQAMEAKTNFLSTVSHELRTPLYAVTGLTHLLLEENPSQSQLEHLKALKFSGDYLLNFINDILQINKIDADKLEPMSVEINLRKVLTDVINSLQQSAKENRTNIILEYDENIPNHLMSDPLKLSQIFMNLVGNALKFTKKGEVYVIAKLVKKIEEDVTLYFEVKDTGIGISKEQQRTIFDSFEQGSIQINREYGGTGLGLTIVKSLLGLFGSDIQLESQEGKGSSFFFELNLKCKEGAVAEMPFEPSDKEYQFEGLHLLLVEDNKINQVITKKMLAKKDITCDIADNGNKAVDLARENSYDGILMDIHMPGISGVEATIEIRKFDKDTPIIALTAISLDDSLEAFYAAGCNDVVTKPFKPEVFYQKIGENILEEKEKAGKSVL